jgi:hypothetical protein
MVTESQGMGDMASNRIGLWPTWGRISAVFLERISQFSRSRDLLVPHELHHGPQSSCSSSWMEKLLLRRYLLC